MTSCKVLPPTKLRLVPLPHKRERSTDCYFTEPAVSPLII